MKKNIIVFLGCLLGCYFLITLNSGCAQIGAPTGGAKDTLPPRLVKASPALNTVNFKGNKVTLSFNEYIDLQDLQGNLIISPLQKTNPVISYNLKSISIKFKDTLLSNTTYSINFGNSIKDVHEGNILRNFTYVFSTGKLLDSLTLEGKVVLAESGKTDSTIIAMLYRNASDTAVLKTKPDYITKLDGEGNFIFKNLPDADFMVFALKDGDGGKTYNSKTELFAFNDSMIKITSNTNPVLLYAYAEQKADINKISSQKQAAEKKLKYTSNITANTQDLLQPFELSFNNPLKKFDSLKVILTDTNYRTVQNYTLTIDSSRKIVSLNTKWLPESDYIFILPKTIATDSSGFELSRTDTIRFKTKKITDYGSLLLRFTNIDLAKHPVIQFLEGENMKLSFPLVSSEWSNKLFPPGEYAIRILYDLNNNGKWDPGDYSKKIQPEKAIQLSQKIAVKADWENERDIKL
jgi:hypothetical protein